MTDYEGGFREQQAGYGREWRGGEWGPQRYEGRERERFEGGYYGPSAYGSTYAGGYGPAGGWGYGGGGYGPTGGYGPSYGGYGPERRDFGPQGGQGGGFERREWGPPGGGWSPQQGGYERREWNYGERRFEGPQRFEGERWGPGPQHEYRFGERRYGPY